MYTYQQSLFVVQSSESHVKEGGGLFCVGGAVEWTTEGLAGQCDEALG